MNRQRPDEPLTPYEKARWEELEEEQAEEEADPASWDDPGLDEW